MTEQETGTISLADEERVKEVLVRSILGLWDVVNDLTKLRPSRRERYRATLFGSARIKPGSFAYEEAKRLSAGLGELGIDVVTGGGPGLMQAANEGAKGRARSIGVRVDLPFEQEVNPFVEQTFTHKTFFTRLHQFVIMSDAFVVLPGGVGTLLEMLMVWQLIQVKHVDNVPLLLVGPMWPDLVGWAEKFMVEGPQPLANAEDMKIPRCLATVEETIAVVRDHHAAWGRTRES